MHHFEMYHPSVLNNKYSSSCRRCEVAQTENTAEYFCRLWLVNVYTAVNDAGELRYNCHGLKQEIFILLVHFFVSRTL